MSWNQDPEGVKLVVNGNAKVVMPSDNFTETVKKMAKDAGLKTFRVIVDGNEIENPGDAPADFNGVTVVKIEPYDEAGQE